MARCGCASDRCSCHFIAGENVSVTGTGSRSNPYVFQVILPDDTGGGTPTSTEGWEAGDIKATGKSAPSTGWLLCDGSLVDRTAFSSLFAAIGTTYGAGDGLTTFRLPDLVGKFPLGSSSAYPRGDVGGGDGTTLELRHLPQHTHSITHDHGSTSVDGSHTHTYSWRQDASVGGPQDNIMGAGGTSGNVVTKRSAGSGESTHQHDVPSYSGNSGSAGSASPDEINTMPPYTAVNYMIKT